MTRFLRRALFALIAIVVLIQFIPVGRTNPPVTARINAPEDVTAIFKRSCYDCHSNETNWRWYTYVAPVSWLTAGDVKSGRKHLNFSDWGSLTSDQQRQKANGIWEHVSENEMPLWIYTLMHPATKLSDTEKETVHRWAEAVRGEDRSEKRGNEPDNHQEEQHEEHKN